LIGRRRGGIPAEKMAVAIVAGHARQMTYPRVLRFGAALPKSIEPCP